MTAHLLAPPVRNLVEFGVDKTTAVVFAALVRSTSGEPA